jgi:hypothetical protein
MPAQHAMQIIYSRQLLMCASVRLAMAAGHLSTQGSLQSAAQLKARSATSSRHALWGRPLDGVNQTDEGDLARAALLALQAWHTVNILQ